VPASSFAWSSLLAVAVLGSVGTAVAFVAFTTLAGRVGSTRASVAVYLVPVVAIALGALFRDETIAAISLVGTVLVTAGAYLTSRAVAGGGAGARRRRSARKRRSSERAGR
jgi:drug/metabolite transporter (DMT)-like permease